MNLTISRPCTDAALASDWSELRRILCIRLDSLGEVLMTTPALRALKHSAPGRQLSLLCSQSGALAAPHLREVDATLVYEAPWVANSDEAGAAVDELMIERLRARRFEAAVIFTAYSQSPLPAALMCRLAGIPRVLAHCRENPYRLLSDRVPETEPQSQVRHEVQRQLDLVAAVGSRSENHKLSFHLEPAARERALFALQSAGLDRRADFVLLHPGASAVSRRYPPELFAQAAQAIYENLELPLVFVGDEGELDLIERIRGALAAPSCSLAGQLDLATFAAVLERARLLVANNSGPVHLAAALGTPVVDLYALTNPQHAPWLVPHRLLTHDVPCRWYYRSVCTHEHHSCMRGIAPQRVADAAAELSQLGHGRRDHAQAA